MDSLWRGNERKPAGANGLSDAQQRLKRREKNRSRHQAPQAGNHSRDHDGVAAPAPERTTAQRVAHDQIGRGEDQKRNRGKPPNHGPGLQHAQMRQMRSGQAIAAGAKTRDGKAEREGE